jgi:hypothetical protein
VPASLAATVGRYLEPDLRHCHQSASSVLADLEAEKEGATVPAVRPPGAQRGYSAVARIEPALSLVRHVAEIG